ncbi:MAG: iron uptake system protein EfeO [Pseudoxanthomonas sp.]
MKTPESTFLRPLALLCALALAACGERTPPQATPTEPAASTPAIDPSELVEPIADYKIYVTAQVQDLVAGTERFVATVKAGKLAEAAGLYPSVRQPWERVEPIAELFSDLDAALDARADDFKGGADDPAFKGWHRLEYAIFKLKRLDGAAPIADQLLADTLELQRRIAALPLEPKPVVGGPAVLVEEVAATKISGEENRYAGTDLWDFRANIDGSQKIVELLRPLIRKADPQLLAEVDANFATVDQCLDKYRRGDGWAPYSEVTDADRTTLRGAISALAEHLAQLRGALGVD